MINQLVVECCVQMNGLIPLTFAAIQQKYNNFFLNGEVGILRFSEKKKLVIADFNICFTFIT